MGFQEGLSALLGGCAVLLEGRHLLPSSLTPEGFGRHMVLQLRLDGQGWVLVIS